MGRLSHSISFYTQDLVLISAIARIKYMASFSLALMEGIYGSTS